jgi:hypothetical protein
MSKYFTNFPTIPYLFGDEEQPVQFQKLSKYVDTIDSFRELTSSYIEYEIRDFERPDTLAYALYGKPEYEWTFFLMNERLREVGWPMATYELQLAAKNRYFKNYIAKLNVSTAEELAAFADIYNVGQSVSFDIPSQTLLLQNGQELLTQDGSTILTEGNVISDKIGTVINKDLDVGEITIQMNGGFDPTGSNGLVYADGSNEVVLSNTVYEYEGTHHYENADGEWVNIFLDPPEVILNAIPVTNLEHLTSQNDEARTIRIIKKDNIEAIVGEFKRLMEAS